MNFDQFWDMIMDLINCMLFQVQVFDDLVVDEMFIVFMGDEVELCC